MTKKKEDKKQVTHTIIVLDKSGSMAGTNEQTVKGVNEQIQTARNNSKDQDIRLSLVSFNNDVWKHFWDVPAGEMEDMPMSAYKPDGGTALWDAAYYVTEKMQRTTEAGDNVAYYVIIVTDGMENSSKHCGKNSQEAEANFARIRASLEETGRWTFSFVGCDSGYIQRVAKNVGIRLDNCALWSNKSATLATRGMKRMARSTGKYYGARAAGAVLNCCTMSDTLEACADYTTDDGEVDAVVPTVTPVVDIKSLMTGVAPAAGSGSYATCNKVDLGQPGMPTIPTVPTADHWAKTPSKGIPNSYGTCNKVTWS